MSERQCGGCVLCCKLIGVEELKKPNGKWCPHCNIGVGCNLWGKEERPQSCGTFLCLWRVQPELVPEPFRPDKVRAVLTATDDGKSMVIFTDTILLQGVPMDFKAWVNKGILKFNDVIVVAGPHRAAFHRGQTLFDKPA